MILQNEYQLLSISRRYQCAPTRFIDKPYTALVLVLLLFGIVGQLEASTVGVSSANVDPNDNELISFVAGGTNYTQSDLIQPTLTEFRGGQARNIAIPLDGSVPDPGSRSLLLTHDFNLDTGIINPGDGATAATLQFSPPLINGPGPDLIMFEGDDRIAPDDFLMQINGNTVAYLAASYDTQLLAVNIKAFARDAGTPDNIFQLENDSYSAQVSFATLNIFGIAIDLDDFGVSPFEMVSSVHFGGPPENGVDPFLFMGIKSADVPEGKRCKAPDAGTTW